ncbi:sulfatase [Blastopirellula sp. JC732]|uniref:Sulfatase n=1 Tax=Blastopirellula sediminis TaxID=2894196 RepID=A0A9X1MRV3_9BACT|nr:sulfatase [Blastopirellula sediminis]MCC9604984.1 sulfatase [Blastopirellula sediminis]MCC9631716.1 sulfatase [Blastopirellula sediminis]
MIRLSLFCFALLGCSALFADDLASRPNILFIFSDDHAIKAISAYGGDLAKVAPTPNIDRLAHEGMLFRNSFCANSICGPSRATILTGKHSHKNGFMRNTGKGLDQSQWTLAKTLQAAGYSTAVIGKWHLMSEPQGFDHWEILPGQGSYYNPDFIQQDGKTKRFEGYATDLTTDKSIAWLEQRDRSKPFLLMCQHKAPHRTFAPPLRLLDAYDDVEIPEPATLFDDYANRSVTLATNEMEIDRHFDWAYDAKVRKDERGDVKLPPPDRYGTPEYNRMNAQQKAAWDAHFGPQNQEFLKEFAAGKMTERDIVHWKYRRYMRNYLCTVKAVDENVGRLLKYLDDNGLAENTVVVYSSDQGFYLGEHGWYDKRWMFEESFRMPLIIRWPGVAKPGSAPEQLVQNIDYAPTFLEMAGEPIPAEIQGRSLVPILKGEPVAWRDSLYYAYYELGEHAVPQHFGVRTDRHKLIHFPVSGEWNLFDLQSDPQEMRSIYDDPDAKEIRDQLTKEYYRLRDVYQAPPLPKPAKGD